MGRHQILSSAQDRRALASSDTGSDSTSRGQEDTVSMLSPLTITWPPFLSCSFKRDFIVMILFSEHKHSSCLFHKLPGSRLGYFLTLTDDLVMTYIIHVREHPRLIVLQLLLYIFREGLAFLRLSFIKLLRGFLLINLGWMGFMDILLGKSQHIILLRMRAIMLSV